MSDSPVQTTPTEARRIADEAVRRARGFSGWRAYEAAKGYVRREHPAREDYDQIIDAIKRRLQI